MIQNNQDKLLQSIDSSLKQILIEFEKLNTKLGELSSYSTTLEDIEMILSNINSKTRRK